MNYSLIFTIYGLVFSIFLLITIVMKTKKKTVRKKLYIALNLASMFLALSEMIVILIFVNVTQNKLIADINWIIRMSSIFIYLCIFIWYYDVLINGEKFPTVKETIFKRKRNLIIGIIFLSLIVLYCMIGGFIFENPADIVYITGTIGYVTLALCIFVALYLLYVALKVRKERVRVYNCFILIFLILIIVSPLQIIFKKISFMPFIAMFILYIVYHNIENPDIDMMEEVLLLKDKIDKSSNTKTDFLFNLSYDLVNPMNVIVSLSDSLNTMSTFDKESILRDVKSIKYAGNTLLDSIDNILNLSDVDEDDKLNIKEYSVYELLKRMESIVISRIGAKQLTFDLTFDDNISSKMLGDINKIQKILLNILNNSVKFTDVGKIKMNVSCTNEKDVQVLHFKISDTGCGMSDEVQAKVYDDSKETGGVGLALTKSYVEAMNGSINFESTFGAGTTFYVHIPQKVVGNTLIVEDKNNDIQTDLIDYLDCSNYKALVVDDDILDVKVTTRLLEKYKFQITTLTSSIECIDRIKQEEQYDILFLDHKMPELDGMDTMKVLKNLEGYKIPKIVALTANAVTGAREYYINNGFDDYLSKPIDNHELDKIIRKNFLK